jgi:hypothetical protein
VCTKLTSQVDEEAEIEARESRLRSAQGGAYSIIGSWYHKVTSQLSQLGSHIPDVSKVSDAQSK